MVKLVKCKRWTQYNSKTFIGIITAINMWIVYSLLVMIQYETENTSIFSSKQETNANKYDASLETPALVILGPAKTGTRSLINALDVFDDTIQYQSERHFWSGSNKYKCRPWYSQDEWLSFIDQFAANKVKLSYLVDGITSHPNNTRCNVNRYKIMWNIKRTMQSINTRYPTKTCIHPYFYDNNSTKSDVKYCYLIEKAPSYINSPWVAAIYSTLLPKTKVIGTIRNPIKHVWSNYWAFNQIQNVETHRYETDLDTIEKHILETFLNSESFQSLSDFCFKMNTKWYALTQLSKQERYNTMKEKYYIKLIALYLRLRFVDPKDILVTLRSDAYVWFPISVINILFWINAYDDHIGYEDNFKMIQFEYLFDNISLSSNKIKCWIMNGIDCKYEDINDVRETQTKSNHALYNDEPSISFVKQIQKIFEPFNEALHHLLNDRTGILIGDWVSVY